jgi:3-oxoadipate enol-lactonase
VTVAVDHVVTGPPDAPVLVLSNSLGTTYALWDRQVDALAERFRLVRYNARGHGETEAPPGPYAIADLGSDVLALLDRLGVERVSFLGLSIGGMTGMWLASHAPERVDRLVLASTTAFFGTPEVWADRIALVRSDGTAAVAAGTIERWLTPEFAAAEPDTAEWLRAMVRSVDDEGYASCCEALRDMDLRGDLPAIRAPTLVIVGADDPSTPPEHAHRIAGAVEGARVLEVPHARHLLNVEHADLFTGAVLEHLEAA